MKSRASAKNSEPIPTSNTFANLLGTRNQNISSMFANLIWEGVRKEIDSAKNSVSIILSLSKFRCVLIDAPPTSTIWTQITISDLEIAERSIKGKGLWSVDIDNMMSSIRSLFTQASLKRTRMSAPNLSNLPKKEELLRASLSDSRSSASPISKLPIYPLSSGSYKIKQVTLKSGTSVKTSPIRTLLLGVHDRLGARSPVHKLKFVPYIFRMVQEYLAPVPFEKRYRFGKQLGFGGQSVVKQATHIYYRTDRLYAVKQVNKCLESKLQEKALKQEAKILRSLCHENLPKVIDFVEDVSHCYMVIECFQGGDLFDRIMSLPEHHYSEDIAKNIVKDLCVTLKYVHSRGITHCDIKPENILFDFKDEHSHLHIVDFGFAQSNVWGKTVTSFYGTTQYAAPEVLSGISFGREVDCWSLGVLAYILLCGYPPFYHDLEKILIKLIKKGSYEFNSPNWDNISEEAKNFIRRLLVVDPDCRAKSDDICSHPWFTTMTDNNLPLVQAEVKKFQARQHWHAAVGVVAFINRLTEIGKEEDDQSDSDEKNSDQEYSFDSQQTDLVDTPESFNRVDHIINQIPEDGSTEMNNNQTNEESTDESNVMNSEQETTGIESPQDGTSNSWNIFKKTSNFVEIAAKLARHADSQVASYEKEIIELKTIVQNQRKEIMELRAKNAFLSASYTISLNEKAKIISGLNSTNKEATVNQQSDKSNNEERVIDVGSQENKNQTYYTLQELQNGLVESCIDPTKREVYLSDQDFEGLFKMTKNEFSKLLINRQVFLKKALRLY